MGSNEKGDRRERELVNLLAGADENTPFDSPYDEGEWAIMRAPASGSATERELPDVFAGNGGVFWAFEAKASGGDPIYIDAEEVEALDYFASFWGAYPRIAIRFDYEEWRFFSPADLHHTPSDNVRVKKEDLEDGATLEDLWTDPLE